MKRDTKPVAGGNPAFDERSPEHQTNQNHAGGNPLFDETTAKPVRRSPLADAVKKARRIVDRSNNA